MENENNRIFGTKVCTSESIAEHVKKHNINLSSEKIIEIADNITNGKEGIHVFVTRNDSLRTIVIRDFVEKDGKMYGIIRTMWDGDEGAGAGNERTGLPIIKHYNDPKPSPFSCKHIGIIPYITDGFCPYCD